MNNQINPLAALKDIQLPVEIGFELALGWWFLLLLILAVLAASFVFLWRFSKQKYLKKKVIQQLFAIKAGNAFASECSMLLRRYAHFYYPNLKINAFSETQWVDFLDQKVAMNDELKQVFLQAVYQHNPDFDPQTVLVYCQKWIDNV